MNRILGALLVVIALVYVIGFVVLAGSSEQAIDTGQTSQTTQTSTATSTTIDPTQPTVTVFILGEKRSIPLPPGVPSVPPGEEQFLNCHYSMPSGPDGPSVLGPGQDPRCAATSGPVVGAFNSGDHIPQSIEELLARMGVTTTTVRR